MDDKTKKRERATLVESENRFRIMADCAPVLLWQCESDGRCTFFNQRWLEFTGRTMEQEVDFGWAEGVHPEDFQHCMDTFTSALNGRKSFAMEYRLRRNDGEFRWIYDCGAPRFLPDGTFVGFIGSCVDITDRKNIERERDRMHAAELAARRVAEVLIIKLEDSLRIKDQFLATVSHELRGPLNAIVGWSQLLKEGPYNEKEFSTGIDAIERGAQIQSKLINDLLDVSRIVSGKLDLKLTAMSIQDTVQAAVDALTPEFSEKNLKVTCHFDSSIGPMVGDSERLQQVTSNLLTNAIRHTPEGGSISVGLSRNQARIFLTIIDTGDGIAPEFLPYIFDRFRQEDSTITRKHSGLGIGLSIVKHLVEQHQGTVTVQSDGKDQGAKFTVELPLRTVSLQTNGNGHSSNGDPAGALKDIHILAVDDQRDALVLLETILKRQGAEVRAASSVAEAMAILNKKDKKIDLVLTDIGMPGESGYDFIRKIRNLPDEVLKNIPVVALTAYARSEDKQYARTLGFNYHLAKPIDTKTLASSILKVLNKTAAS